MKDTNNPENNQTNPNKDKDVVLLDSYNMIYRAFHGNRNPMKNADGLPTNAIYTVTAMLQKLPQNFTNLEYALAVFDGGKLNFRKEIDDQYKANRKPMPDELRQQMPHIMRVFEILGWPVFQAQDVEADDIIGTLAVRAANKGFGTYIISSDKDFRAIAKDNLNIIDQMNDICYNPKIVEEKMGIPPEYVTAYLALLGDSSDNVIGVDKIGEKTASRLLMQYKGIEGLRAHQSELTGVAGKNIQAAFANGQIDKNLSLIQLKTDVDIQLKSHQMRLKPVDMKAFEEFCKEMNFMSILKRIQNPQI